MPRWPLHVLLPAVMLAGCAQWPASPAASGSEQQQAHRGITAFALNGRIAIHQEQRQYAANISWQHAPQRDEIMLASPLGQGLAELTRDAGGARLTTAERREYTAPDWQTLAARMFGLDLPLEDLPRWLVGDVPATALGLTYDLMTRPQQFVIDDWQVVYLDYASAAADALPSMVELRRGDIVMRMKIDEWRLPP